MTMVTFTLITRLGEQMAHVGRRPKASSAAGQTSKQFHVKASLEDSSSPGDLLRKKYPQGHPLFIANVLNDIELHAKKNRDYAAGGDVLGNFKRVALLMSHYPNFPVDTPRGIAIVYMLKQLDAVMWNMCIGHILSEGREAREQDIAIYATLIRCMEQEGV